MQFQIEVINVQTTSRPTKTGGTYTMLDVAFKRLDTGKIEGKKVVSFASKSIFDLLSKAKNGDQFSVTSEKNEQTTYWEWTVVIPVDATTAASVASTTPKAGFASPKSTYETADAHRKENIDKYLLV